MGRSPAAIAILALPILTGCGGENAPGDEAEPGWISYSRSGGLAYVAETLDISPAGDAKLTIASGAPGEGTTRFELDEAEHEELINHLEALDFASLDAGSSPACADCYLYELEYDGADAEADSATATKEFTQAIDPLEELIASHRPPAGGP